MIGIGLVGVGFMGMIHYLAARKLADARVVALCDSDANKLAGDWTGIQGNFGPRGTQMDLSGLALYRELDKLLADPAVDLVDLCVPTDTHAKLAVRALEAGKHVLVEKPIALSMAQADAMNAAAARNGKLLMVAHVLPFFPEFAFALDSVRSGRHGPLRAAHFKRVISRPDWSAAIADPSKTGGPAIDLHIHDSHFIGLMCGLPQAVHSRGVVEKGAVAHLATHYLYDAPNFAVTCVSGAISAPGRPFAHAFELYFDQTTIAYDFATIAGEGRLAVPLSLILPDGKVECPALGSSDPIDAFSDELAAAVQSVATGKPADRLSGELASSALKICLAEVESVQSGRVVSLESMA